ncbi:acidic mammalian chitinase [Biomphalaria glabrata]|nr:acidic mammalian chitinase [Biomphalaria glabrata]
MSTGRKGREENIFATRMNLISIEKYINKRSRWHSSTLHQWLTRSTRSSLCSFPSTSSHFRHAQKRSHQFPKTITI